MLISQILLDVTIVQNSSLTNNSSKSITRRLIQKRTSSLSMVLRMHLLLGKMIVMLLIDQIFRDKLSNRTTKISLPKSNKTYSIAFLQTCIKLNPKSMMLSKSRA